MATPDVTPTKRCSKCERVLPAIPENFRPRARYTYGVIGVCRDCERLGFEVTRKTQEYIDYQREYRKTYVKPPKTRQRQRDYNKEYLKNNPDVFTEKEQRRRAKKNKLPASFTIDDWDRCVAYFNGCCAVCGRPPGLWHTLAQDHWIPVVKGGGYTTSNIVPLCHGIDGCNNSKKAKDANEWLLERFGKRKANNIAHRIESYFEWRSQL